MFQRALELVVDSMLIQSINYQNVIYIIFLKKIWEFYNTLRSFQLCYIKCIVWPSVFLFFFDYLSTLTPLITCSPLTTSPLSTSKEGRIRTERCWVNSFLPYCNCYKRHSWCCYLSPERSNKAKSNHGGLWRKWWSLFYIVVLVLFFTSLWLLYTTWKRTDILFTG